MGVERTAQEAPVLSDERFVTQSQGWGMMPLLCLCASTGILIEAFADAGGRASAWWADLAFWLGLLVIFLPLAYRATQANVSRTERLMLVTLLGVALYVVKFLQYPLGFSQNDEFQHWRSALDIAASGHLFQQNNLLPVGPMFPGLEIVTNAISTLGGSSIFVAATLVIGAARVLLMLTLFLFSEAVSASPRVAAFATIAFLGNPLFLFFDAQFAYESLALPLAICVLLAVLRLSEAAHSDRWKWRAIILALIGATAITHHLTSYALLGCLAVWTLVRLLARRVARDPGRPMMALTNSIEINLAWLVVVGGLVVRYLSAPIMIGVQNVVGIILQEDSTRVLFHDGAGGANPLWQQLLSVADVATLTACVFIGCWLIWRRRDSTVLLTLGLLSLAYPASQALRFTKDGASYATRPMDFFFVAVAVVVALVASKVATTEQWARWQAAASLAGLTIIFVGAVAIGSGPSWTRLPGRYMVEGRQRSWNLESTTAAQWTLAYLGSGNAVATDEDSSLLMSTYGMQNIVTRGQGIDLADVYFAPTIGPYQRSLLRRAHVRYVVSDLRLATALPAFGSYYESGETHGRPHTQPISIQALTKYGATSGVDCVYDSGNIEIYDVGQLIYVGTSG